MLIISQLVLKAKQQKGHLKLVWLDLTRTYESVPHDLIQVLNHCVTPVVKQVNWEGIQMRITAGCTSYPILSIAGITL